MNELELVLLIDQVIKGLHETALDTVPEILYGYQEYPKQGSNEDLLCRIVENLIVSNDFAKIKTIDPNQRLFGYYDLSLTPLSFELILYNRTCDEVLQKGELAESTQHIQIIFSCGERNIINTGSNNNLN